MIARDLPTLCTTLVLFASILVAAPRAQSVLDQGDVAVATTNGVYVLHPGQTAVRVLAGPLVEPAIEWEPDSDRLYVVSGNELLAVTVQSFATGGGTAQTIATFPAGTSLTDLDVDHSTGDVWLLDRTLDQALRFSAPVSPGAMPDLTVQLVGNTLALCVDSVNWPLSIVYATTTGLMRQTIDGTVLIEVGKSIEGDAAVDVGWQLPAQGTFFVDTDAQGIYLDFPGPSLFAATIQSPVAALVYRPTDIEWLPNSGRFYVVTSDGLNPAAFPTVPPGSLVVHVVMFRPGGGQVGGVPLVDLITEPNGLTGVYGTQADLTIVLDGAFVGPYGSSSPAYSGEAPELRYVSSPQLGNTAFAVEIVGAPPGRPAFVGLSIAPANTLVNGGLQLIAAPLWMPVGMTDPLGDLLLPAPVPNDPALTAMDLFTQAVVFGNDLEPAFSHALRVRFR